MKTKYVIFISSTSSFTEPKYKVYADTSIVEIKAVIRDLKIAPARAKILISDKSCRSMLQFVECKLYGHFSDLILPPLVVRAKKVFNFYNEIINALEKHRLVIAIYDGNISELLGKFQISAPEPTAEQILIADLIEEKIIFSSTPVFVQAISAEVV